PHILAREMYIELPHPTIGTFKTTGIPIKLSKTPGKITMAPPLLGQHTEEIMKEMGYSDEEIKRLRKEGIIR
ncbi:MAG: CoA transferase, partial [Candidatus Tectomicrobia bacterium]|nr:CoA transferase [Candidatus Tectomicrobia bacterium]